MLLRSGIIRPVRRMSLGRQLLLLQLVVVAVVVSVAGFIAVRAADDRATEQQRERALSMAQACPSPVRSGRRCAATIRRTCSSRSPSACGARRTWASSCS